MTVQGPVKEPPPDGMSHRGGGWRLSLVCVGSRPLQRRGTYVSHEFMHSVWKPPVLVHSAVSWLQQPVTLHLQPAASLCVFVCVFACVRPLVDTHTHTHTHRICETQHKNDGYNTLEVLDFCFLCLCIIEFEINSVDFAFQKTRVKTSKASFIFYK